MKLLCVWLDNADYGAGPGTVLQIVQDTAEFLRIATDRDGAIDPRLRCWRGDFEPGDRVSLMRASPVL